MPIKNEKERKAWDIKYHAARREHDKQQRLHRYTRLRKWYRAYKAGVGCMLCPETHPACVSFHHRDPNTKKFEVSVGVTRIYSVKNLLTEIAKCDAICHNCHAKLHYNP